MALSLSLLGDLSLSSLCFLLVLKPFRQPGLHKKSSSSRMTHLYMPLQDVCRVSQNSLKNVKEIPGDGSWNRGTIISTAPGSAPLCSRNRRSTARIPQKDLQWATSACFWPNYDNQSPWAWHEGLTSCNEACVQTSVIQLDWHLPEKPQNWQVCH